MDFKIELGFKDYNNSGILIAETWQKANSLVVAFARQLFGIISLQTQAIIDQGNVSRDNLGNDADNLRCNAPAATSTYGIMVGSGTTAVNISDYKLTTRIEHGTGVGQLSYSAMSFDATATTSGSSCFFQLYRTVTNNTANTITIEEVGLAGVGSTNAWLFLYDHTLATKVLTAGSATTITYKFNITV